MDALLLSLKAIRWRAGASLTMLLIAVFATAVAAAGPVYLAAAGDSILQYTLRSAPPTATGGGMEVTNDVAGRPDTAQLTGAVADARRGAVLRRAYPHPIAGLEFATRLLDGSGAATALATVVYRQDVCAHVRLVAGSCVAAGSTDQVIASRRTANDRRWAVGTTVLVEHFADAGAARPMRVVGVYDPVAADAGYWFNDTRGYLGASARAATATGPAPLDALFVPASAFAVVTQVPAGEMRAVVDLPLRPDAVHTADVAALRRAVDTFGTRLDAAGVDQHGFNGSVVTKVRALLDRAGTGQATLRLPMLLVTGELLLLGWYVLFMVATAASEARGGEVALAKLRGLPAGATLAFGVIESVLLLAVSVPLGVAAGAFAVRVFGRPVLGAGTVIAFPATAWATAFLAAAGGLVAAGLGGVATFRRPVLAQWRRADREAGRRSAAADTVVLTLAAAGLGELWWGGSLAGGRLDVLALAAPGLLALAGALVGARLLPVLARAGLGTTRGSPRIGVFLALRQVARRPGGPRVVAVLATAFALATFSVLAWSVFAQNRHDRAFAETGAARIVAVDPGTGPDVRAVVDRLDRDGRQAMAVTEVDSEVAASTSADLDTGDGPSAAPMRLLAVDPARLGRIGFWRPDFGASTLSGVARTLSAPLPPAVTARGDALRLAATSRVDSGGPMVLGIELTTAGGAAARIPLTPTVDGGYQADVPCRDGPCRLRAVTVARADGGLTAAVGTVVVTAVDVRTGGGWQPVAGALDPARWQPANPTAPGQSQPVEHISAGLTLRYAAPPSVRRIGLVAAAPARIPAVVTTAYRPPPGTRALTLGAPTGPPLDVDAVGTVRVLPRAGDAGAVVSYDALVAARPGGYTDLLPTEVWLAAGAPADFPARLAAAGVRVLSVTSAAQREEELSHQGPALAVALMLAGAAAAALLSAAGAVVNLHLLGRRRAFELAAMRTLGVGRASLAAGVGVEQAILVGYAILVGVSLGVLGARMALPSVPEYADLPSYPPLLVQPAPAVVAGIVAGLAGLLGAALAVSGYLLVRAAVPSRLREAQP